MTNVKNRPDEISYALIVGVEFNNWVDAIHEWHEVDCPEGKVGTSIEGTITAIGKSSLSGTIGIAFGIGFDIGNLTIEEKEVGRKEHEFKIDCCCDKKEESK